MHQFRRCRPAAELVAAQRAQMQARPRAASGTEASKAGSNDVVRHQQGVSKLPHCAGAQALAPPHKGQHKFRIGGGCDIGSDSGG